MSYVLTEVRFLTVLHDILISKLEKHRLNYSLIGGCYTVGIPYVKTGIHS